MEAQTGGNWNAPDLLAGMNVIILGDIMQLPPVKDNHVFDWPYKKAKGKPKAYVTKHNGYKAYSLIENTVLLKKNQRQRANPNDSFETTIPQASRRVLLRTNVGSRLPLAHGA